MARRGNSLGFYDIASRFEEVFQGKKNFITPKVLRYGRRGKYFYEISEGESPLERRKKIYGVTVITSKGEHVHDLSQCFGTYGTAINYARNLPYESDLRWKMDERGWNLSEEE